MTYKDAVKYLDSIANYEKTDDFDYKKSLKLERMRSFSRRLGNPHEAVKAIHVAGTKGKGSVSSFINSILINAGRKTGLYTSPHLVSFRERIRIDGEPISERDVPALLEKMSPHIEAMAQEEEKPTYFEICTLMAFLYFKERGADFMVLETGMGGRLDATNIVRPLISVITAVSCDHVKHLGPAIEDIAFEKCGIIKDNSVVVSSPQGAEALQAVKRAALEKKSKLYVVGEDAFFEKLNSNLERQIFNLITRREEYPNTEIRMLGDFQLENAAAAVLAVEGLRHYGIFVDKAKVSFGLRNAKWPGRFEVIEKRPLIIVDGAQNSHSASALKKSVRLNLKYKKLFLVLGVMSDKDIDGICAELGEIADYVIAAASASPRALSPQSLKDKMLGYMPHVECAEAVGSVAEAIDRSLALAGQDDAVLITGSLYVVGEALESFEKLKAGAT